jgi:hypothetical protein
MILYQSLNMSTFKEGVTKMTFTEIRMQPQTNISLCHLHLFATPSLKLLSKVC